MRLFPIYTWTKIFINNYSGFFVDKVGMLVDYHGDLYSRINFDFYNFRLPSSFAFRSNNVYYTDIEDENNVSTFCHASDRNGGAGDVKFYGAILRMSVGR